MDTRKTLVVVGSVGIFAPEATARYSSFISVAPAGRGFSSSPSLLLLWVDLQYTSQRAPPKMWMDGSTVHFPARAPQKFGAYCLLLTRGSRWGPLALGVVWKNKFEGNYYYDRILVRSLLSQVLEVSHGFLKTRPGDDWREDFFLIVN